MREVGLTLHLAKSGKLIIRSKHEVPAGVILYDGRGRRIGRVTEIFGPVAAPYIAADPLTDRIKRVLGEKVYSEEGA